MLSVESAIKDHLQMKNSVSAGSYGVKVLGLVILHENLDLSWALYLVLLGSMVDTHHYNILGTSFI